MPQELIVVLVVEEPEEDEVPELVNLTDFIYQSDD